MFVRTLLLAPLLLALGVLAMCTGPFIGAVDRPSPAGVESCDAARTRRTSQIRALYERIKIDGPLGFSKTPWMSHSYHIRLQRDERGQVLLSADGYIQKANSQFLDDLPSARGRRVALVLRDIDSDGRPDEYAGPALYSSESAPLFSLSPAQFRRPRATVATAVNTMWDNCMDELARRELLHDGAGAPR